MHSICSDFLKYLKEKGLKAATIEIYENAVKQFTQWLIENGILSFFAADRETLEQFFNHVHKRDIKPHTRYRICSSVKALYAWLQQENRILTNPAPRIRTLREKRLPHAIPTQKELKTVYRTLQKSAQTNHAHYCRERDFTLIDLAYTCALRRCEIHRLDVGDISLDEHTVKVRGKGDRERIVPLGARCADVLKRYIFKIRPRFISTGKTNALFISWQKGGTRLNIHSINAIFSRLRRKKILPSSVHPHALRHASATGLLHNGAPIQDVSKILGHKKLETTQIYTHVTIKELKKVHKKFHPRG